MINKPDVLSLRDVSVVRQGRHLIERVSVDIEAGEHWAVIGPNGAGKSTLLALCGAHQHPTTGTVHVLGHQLGKVDMRSLRTRIGHVDPRTRIESHLTARQAVFTGLLAATDIPRRWSPTRRDDEMAQSLLDTLGLTARQATPWSVLSQGERGRVLIARALITQPDLLLMDEPTTGLDLAAREILLRVLAELNRLRPELATVLVTHHLEELPTSTTHALIVAAGRVVAAGPVGVTLTSPVVSQAFEYPVHIVRRGGRWSATGSQSPSNSNNDPAPHSSWSYI